MDNITQHKSFLWHLDFEPFTWHTFYGEQCPPFVNEENKEAWRRYLTIVIKKHLKAEVMNTPEFRDIEIQIREEKLLCIKWDEQRKRSMEKQRYRAKMDIRFLTVKEGVFRIPPSPFSQRELHL